MVKPKVKCPHAWGSGPIISALWEVRLESQPGQLSETVYQKEKREGM